MNDELNHSENSEQQIMSESLTLTEQRSLIFHLLYAIDCFDYDTTLESIADNFSRGFGVVIPPDSFVFRASHEIIVHREELDALIIPLIENWRLDRLGVPTRLILRMGIWELKNAQIDRAVIINEAVELAKCFAEKDAYKFINGVLDEYLKRPEASQNSK
jgi:transcription antitermination protein NusB